VQEGGDVVIDFIKGSSMNFFLLEMPGRKFRPVLKTREFSTRSPSRNDLPRTRYLGCPISKPYYTTLPTAAKLVADSDAATGLTSIAFQERVHILTGSGM
jgi:hypothetical protein